MLYFGFAKGFLSVLGFMVMNFDWLACWRSPFSPKLALERKESFLRSFQFPFPPCLPPTFHIYTSSFVPCWLCKLENWEQSGRKFWTEWPNHLRPTHNLVWSTCTLEFQGLKFRPRHSSRFDPFIRDSKRCVWLVWLREVRGKCSKSCASFEIQLCPLNFSDLDTRHVHGRLRTQNLACVFRPS